MILVLQVNIFVAEICRFQCQENDIADKIARSLPNCITGSNPTQISPGNNHHTYK